MDGIASGSTWILIGGPVIIGSGWCGHLLNVDAENLSSSHCFILLLFFSVGSNGSSFGRVGGSSRFGQLQVYVLH